MALLWAAACGDDGGPVVDASGIDGENIDSAAPIDGPTAIDATPTIDAPTTAIGQACSNACSALEVCFGGKVDETCNSECEADLADCTPAQVDEVERCATLTCTKNPSAIPECLMQITCVDTGGK